MAERAPRAELVADREGLVAVTEPELPPEVDERVRADLHDLHVLDRAAAPDPEDIVATMRANGLHDPEPPFEAWVQPDRDGYWSVDLPDRRDPEPRGRD